MSCHRMFVLLRVHAANFARMHSRVFPWQRFYRPADLSGFYGGLEAGQEQRSGPGPEAINRSGSRSEGTVDRQHDSESTFGLSDVVVLVSGS